ncbi:ATP-binding protein [Streptomyces sp. NPDC102467]|uniref:ATP-binding protein n=1 Tax=Streptomyces sp. NPDC102467 TaxID=3366179 RepID=UPI003830056C
MPESGPDPDPWEYTVYFPNDLRAVTVCRRALRLILTLHGPPQLVETAELLATELASNAVRHTEGPAGLRLHYKNGVLRIGVWDADPNPPSPPLPAPLLVPADAEQGRGLDLVRACADGWGWYPLMSSGPTGGSGRGKYVWCDLGVA